MEKQYQLNLVHQNVTNVNFVINYQFKWENKPVKIEPIFSNNIEKLDDNDAKVTISCEIGPLENNPFYLHVDVVGLFNLNGWEEDPISREIVNINTIAILFPYLRQAVSTITSMSGLPPYVLPVVNTAALFKK